MIYWNRVSPLLWSSLELLIKVSLLLAPASCSMLISDEFPDYEPVPALNAILVAGQPLQVQLSLAGKIDTTDIVLVEDGAVVISGPGFPEFELPHLQDGMYCTYGLVAPGEIYGCEAVVGDYAPLYASDTVPAHTEVEIVWQSNQSRFDEEGNYMEGIEFEFYDDPSTDDFYEVALYKWEHDYLGQVWAFNENDPVLLNEGLDPFSTGALIFSDELMEDSLVRMKLDCYSGTHVRCSGDSCWQIMDEHTLILELRHVSRAYYQYKKSFYIYEKTRYPDFVEGVTTATDIWSNVENGHGIFASYASALDSIHVEEEHIPR